MNRVYLMKIGLLLRILGSNVGLHLNSGKKYLKEYCVTSLRSLQMKFYLLFDIRMNSVFFIVLEISPNNKTDPNH